MVCDHIKALVVVNSTGDGAHNLQKMQIVISSLDICPMTICVRQSPSSWIQARAERHQEYSLVKA